MLYKHFIIDLTALKIDPLAEVDVESITYSSGFVSFCDFARGEQVQDLKDEIESLEAEVRDYKEAEGDINKVERELDTLKTLLKSYEISPTDTIKDLVERNDWQAEELKRYKELIQNYNKKILDLERDLKQARSRKNRATVKRCVNTDKLTAVFQNVEYKLIKKI